MGYLKVPSRVQSSSPCTCIKSIRLSQQIVIHPSWPGWTVSKIDGDKPSQSEQDKTEILVFIGRYLGGIFNPAFKLDEQICAVVSSSFYQLQLLSKVKHCIPFDQFGTVIHAFITSCLDYSNSLYTFQPVPTSTTTGHSKHDCITAILASLHWLPLHFRTQFKCYSLKA